MKSIDSETRYPASSENAPRISLGEYIDLRERSLERIFYDELQERGIAPDQAYKIVRKAFLFHRKAWQRTESDELRDALSRIKLPTPKPPANTGPDLSR